MQEKLYYVYILAKARNSTFYTGVTHDLIRRTWEHKQGLADGFTTTHKIKKLVYFEAGTSIESAIAREKIIKKWGRAIKMEAIERQNPEWADLYYDLIGDTEAFEASKEKLSCRRMTASGQPDPVMKTG